MQAAHGTKCLRTFFSPPMPLSSPCLELHFAIYNQPFHEVGLFEIPTRSQLISRQGNVRNLSHPCLGECHLLHTGQPAAHGSAASPHPCWVTRGCHGVPKGKTAAQLGHELLYGAAMLGPKPTQGWLCRPVQRGGPIRPRWHAWLPGTRPQPGLHIPLVPQHLHRCTMSPPLCNRPSTQARAQDTAKSSPKAHPITTQTPEP